MYGSKILLILFAIMILGGCAYDGSSVSPPYDDSTSGGEGGGGSY